MRLHEKWPVQFGSDNFSSLSAISTKHYEICQLPHNLVFIRLKSDAEPISKTSASDHNCRRTQKHEHVDKTACK